MAGDGRPEPPEELEAFRAYVRAWLPDGLPRLRPGPDRRSLPQVAADHRVLQRRLWDANLAGIMYPKEYGGLGFSRAHQSAFLQEAAGYELPTMMSVTLGILMPTLMDYGTPEQCHQHIPAALRGEEIWVQLLSEPSGGSDMAAALTRIDVVDDGFVVNGSKIWTTHGHVADYGMLLARTDPELPKHKGLSVLLVPLTAPGVTVTPIVMSTGASDFCEEFFDDVRLPKSALLGSINDGWAIIMRQLFHERNMVGNNGLNDSRYTGPLEGRPDVAGTASRLGLGTDPVVRQLVGEAVALQLVEDAAVPYLDAQISANAMPATAASIIKLLTAQFGYRIHELDREIAGVDGVIADAGAGDPATLSWLAARAGTVAGGTNEMHLNQISEHVLGLPREHAPDRGVPFSRIQHN